MLRLRSLESHSKLFAYNSSPKVEIRIIHEIILALCTIFIPFLLTCSPFVRLIDSAQAYNESAIGYAWRSSAIQRSDVFIVSKIHPKNLGFDTTIQSIDESLSNLQTDYVDLMLIHSKDCDEGPGALLVCGKGEPKGDWIETWRALEFMVKKGKYYVSVSFNYILML